MPNQHFTPAYQPVYQPGQSTGQSAGQSTGRARAGLVLVGVMLGWLLSGVMGLRAAEIDETAAEIVRDGLNQVKFALIIDDVGNHRQDEQALNLPGPLTVAILPHTPHSKRLAQQAQQHDVEVLVHLPMQALSGKALGPGGVTLSQSETELRSATREAIAAVPFAVGMNNHMGSAFTAEARPLRWVLEELKTAQLFFLDSRTTAATQAETIARELQLPYLRRHVFLDNEADNATAIRQQFRTAIKYAQQHGEVILIGHPYPTTLQVLAEELPKLKGLGIEQVKASALL